MKNILFALLFAVPLASDAQMISTYAGNGTMGNTGDGGQATAAAIESPLSVACDGSGNCYFIDGGACLIRKINSSGIISLYAGHGSCLPDLAGTMSGDNGPAVAGRLNGPSGIAVDGTGNLYIADKGNHRVRMVTTAGTISTIAGGGVSGTVGDNGPATAADIEPVDVAVDGAGAVYITDKANRRVRKINTATGIITTVAGTGSAGSAGDGAAATIATVDVSAIAVDNSGNIFVVNGTNKVRKITAATGIITTIAGGSVGYSGDGGPATAASLNTPMDLAVDAAGNVYISDLNNQVIRKVNGSGIITTVAGNHTSGYSGDGGAAISAQFSEPMGVAVDNAGNLIIADLSNQRLRRVSNIYAGVHNVAAAAEVAVYPIPATNTLFVNADVNITSLRIINLLGQPVYSGQLNSTKTAIDISALQPGSYFIRINNEVTKMFVKL